MTPPASRGLPERPDPAERELHLKAGLHDLVAGKTCADRLAAVSTLRKLGDKRGREPTKNGPVAAIDPLKACGRLFIEERASLFARDTLPS